MGSGKCCSVRIVLGMSWSCRRGSATASLMPMASDKMRQRTCVVEEMMREPPAAPTAAKKLPSSRSTMTGVMDESGRFPGRM